MCQRENFGHFTLHLLQMFLANMHENFQENQQELKALKTCDRVLTTYCDLMFQATKMYDS